MTKRLVILLASLALVVPFVFYGCGGSDGATGAAGANGAAGPAGPAGPVTNTNESCMVCHTQGRIADISDQSTGVHFAPLNSLPSLTVDNIVTTDNGSGNLVVSFTVKIDNNAPYTALADNGVNAFAANLVPAGTVASDLNGTPQSTAQFNRWAFERTGTFNTAFNYPVDNTFTNRPYVFGTLDNTNAASGNYTYTFATPLGSTTPYDNALANFSITNTQRVYIKVAHAVSNVYSAGVGFEDFTLSGASPPYTVTNTGFLARQFVTIEACQKCHGPKNQVMDHGPSYVDINGCVICHSQITNANNGMGGGSRQVKAYMFELWFGNLIHKIHNAQGSLMVKKQADAEFPQDIRVCVSCHSNPTGKALGAGDLIANWKNHPTAEYCGTCHIGFPATSHKATYRVVQTSTLHPGGSSLTSDCVSCHPNTNDPVTSVVFPTATVHNTSPEPGSFNAFDNNVPEFDVTFTLSPVKAFYVAGDNVTVTATLKKHSDGTAVASTVYTTAKDTAGVAGGGLTVASIAFYGPRAMPKGILGLPPNAAGLSPQSANLFVGSRLNDNTVNSRVLTDNTAFKYQLTIPTGVTTGTYGLRLRFADYGRIGTGNSKVESIGFGLVQVGSATGDKKVAGDICVNCHGAPPVTFPGHDERHVVVWDTDQCNSCHDYSGNHAAVLSNRVHAVHSANTLGDMLNTQSMQTATGFNAATIDVDWSDITYPQSISNCATCHNSGNTSYRKTVHEVSCLGCHGDNINTTNAINPGGATNHMLQNGGEFPTP